MKNVSDAIVDGLWNEEISPDNYGTGDGYQEHLFSQYEMYVEMADRVSQRRNLANTFFLTLNTLISTVFGFLYKEIFQLENDWLVLIPLIAVLALCFVWWRIVKSYRQLNTAKFKVIGEYETRLPSSPYWAAEWRTLGEGKDPRLYKPLADVEKWVPVVFGVLYIAAAAYVIWGQ